MEISSEHLHFQTQRSRELKFWEKVHIPLHVSWVTCHVSHFKWHMSHFMCHFFPFFIIMFYKGRNCLVECLLSTWLLRLVTQKFQRLSEYLAGTAINTLVFFNNYKYKPPTLSLIKPSIDTAFKVCRFIVRLYFFY